MNNPFLRRALQLEDSFFNFKTAGPQTAVIPQNFEHLNFRQLIAQHTDEQLPSGRSLYKKIKWAHEHYGDKVPETDFAENSLTQRQTWNKWKEFIRLSLLEDLVNKDQDSQDITIIAAPEGTVTINEIGLAVAPQPNIAIDDQILSTTGGTVIKIDEPTVNPAPPVVPQPTPIVNPAPPVVPQPTPIVNPAPPVAPQPTPIVNPAPPVAPQPTPIVNPAPPVAPQPEPIVNPAPPIAPQPEPIVNPAPPVVPQPEPIVNPAPPIAPQPEPIVNPAPPVAPQPEPIVNPAPPVVPQPEPIVNPAPPIAPQPEPIVNPAPPVVPQPEPIVNPAPPVAPQPEPIVNPAPPVAPQPEPIVNPAPPVVPQPTPTVNPAPPITEDKEVFDLAAGSLIFIEPSPFEIIDCGPFLSLGDIDFSQQSLTAAKGPELEPSVQLFSASNSLSFSDLLSDEQRLSNIFNGGDLDSTTEEADSKSQNYAAIISAATNVDPLVVEQLYIDL